MDNADSWTFTELVARTCHTPIVHPFDQRARATEKLDEIIFSDIDRNARFLMLCQARRRMSFPGWLTAGLLIGGLGLVAALSLWPRSEGSRGEQ